MKTQLFQIQVRCTSIETFSVEASSKAEAEKLYFKGDGRVTLDGDEPVEHEIISITPREDITCAFCLPI